MFNYLIYYWNKFFKVFRGVAIRNSSLGYDTKIESGTLLVDSSIGNYTYTGHDCTILDCKIGSFCSIANYVSIGGAAHPMHFVSTSPVFLSHKDSVKTKFSRHIFLPKIITNIGNDVWIGESAIIKAGVTIGNGAVIGAGAVVTKDIPSYAIFAGNPARLIKYRFSEEICQALEKTYWWTMNPDELLKLAKYFNEPEQFITEFNKNLEGNK